MLQAGCRWLYRSQDLWEQLKHIAKSVANETKRKSFRLPFIIIFIIEDRINNEYISMKNRQHIQKRNKLI